MFTVTPAYAFQQYQRHVAGSHAGVGSGLNKTMGKNGYEIRDRLSMAAGRSKVPPEYVTIRASSPVIETIPLELLANEWREHRMHNSAPTVLRLNT